MGLTTIDDENISCHAEITIVFHITYKCGIILEITLNITLHGSNSKRLLRNFIP